MGELKNNITFLTMADAAIPEFKEERGKNYVSYGKDNLYPEYLEYLYNKSPKHNAIITFKRIYIFGKGYEQGDFVVNRLNESLNDVTKKLILDLELYGGWRLEVVWSPNKKVGEIYHVPFRTLRKGNDNTYVYKRDWSKYSKQDTITFPAFSASSPFGSQIYAFDEYSPNSNFYPYPNYIAANNAIETDYEMSKFWLSGIRNGMAPSKLIQLYLGEEPPEEGKRAIEKAYERKFTGAENAGRFMLAFHASKDNKVDIDDLSGSDMDKMFVELNKTVQQEIFTAHNITSPMLFGIKTEGQLGGATELATSYSIFQNTYARAKAQSIDRELSFLLSFSIYPAQKYQLQESTPIEAVIDVHDVVNSLPKSYVFEKLGVPKEKWDEENIGADNRATPTIPIAPAATPPGAQAQVNETLKNLTPQQHKQIQRIVRDYGKGRITRAIAAHQLSSGFGLSDADVSVYLDDEPTQFSEEETAANMFSGFGDPRADFEILKSKPVHFSSTNEAAEDEGIFLQSAFKNYDVTITEDRILELIRQDPHITSDVIAGIINQSVDFVDSKIEQLQQKGYLERGTAVSGEDEIIEWSVPPRAEVSAPPPEKGTTDPVRVKVMYSYEPKSGLEPVIPTTRPFCKKLIQLDRLYSRADIEKISARLGYSVWNRKGGWWGHKEECRHRWVSSIVIKKAPK
jgi:hypothetical protein